ncbi:MAG TPA: phosphoribosylaminoimidazolesuccinocarboxamide synthase [Thermoanaerobaculia bacterium]|jgi:phosphoribosylaminoimidazole-succinocarboxamide synthase|nr:phosphoribosylaminoimidazolesuccinocarboxamide synthase [Thermoanaerobaculia bacterium]HQN08258.1 phosphoribosylaminoimidazolesuccinocarboxamide synthase [Thermoanaerobaculia bacterium]HQP86902.1 phosphoribosylaminoimidazolesuccinocarboxamide synthase [Thermoanaerobaculia bacterium]
MPPAALDATALPGLPPPRRGKVRDVYDLGERLLIVATDRISAFDVVLSPGIPGKGAVLTQLSTFWFRKFAGLVPNHLVETDARAFPPELAGFAGLLEGRSVLARKCRVVPFECVARGWLAGSGWKDYRRSGAVCGVPLPAGLSEASRLSEPVFTPATKAEEGHDENVSFEAMANAVGRDLATRLRDLTLAIYTEAAAYAAGRGVIVADTKLEFGLDESGSVVWIDEALTPDSSRFWPAASWREGGSPPSYDKQFVRDWLETTGWDKTPPAPLLPPSVVAGTLERYVEAYRALTGADPLLPA